jgi:NitT/TauT family transport system permease protein
MLLETETWLYILHSLFRLILGYLLAMVVGVSIGLLMGLNEKINKMINPLVVILQSTPNISWILLAIIWFGLNYRVIVFTIFISIVPIFIINTREGINNISKDLLNMASVYQLSWKSRLKCIYLPSIKPYIVSAGVITIERGWKIGAMAELLSLDIGIRAGLYWARNNLETEKVFAWTIILVTLGFFSSQIIKRAFKKSRSITNNTV